MEACLSNGVDCVLFQTLPSLVQPAAWPDHVTASPPFFYPYFVPCGTFFKINYLGDPRKTDLDSWFSIVHKVDFVVRIKKANKIPLTWTCIFSNP